MAESELVIPDPLEDVNQKKSVVVPLTNIKATSKGINQVHETKQTDKGEPLTEEEEEKLNKYETRFKRILFVVTDVNAAYGKALNPHLGIAMLMAYLDKKSKITGRDFQTAVIDLQLGYTVDDVVKKAKELNADLIGITMFSFDFARTYKIIDEIKEKTQLPIVLGGAHISTVKSEALEKTKADFAITRDGEIPIYQLCAGYPLEDVKSLIWKTPSGVIVENMVRKLNWDLDSLPYPAYDKFEMTKYIHYIDRRLPLETSRGCPYACTYCDVKLSMGQAFRPRGPEEIIKEIKYWYDKGFRFFEFVDDVFTMDLERAKKVCDLIMQSGMKFDWNCANGIRADRVDEELIIKMKQAGCVFVAYGLETGNPDMLKIIKKSITLEKATETFKLTKKLGLKFAVNFIIGHQEETFERAMDSIRYARTIPADYLMFSNMIPYPGTEVYQWIVKNVETGRARWIKKPEEYLRNTTTKIGDPVYETDEFTFEERKEALNIAREVFNKSFLKYRFGKVKGTLIYAVCRDNDRYIKLRRLAMGTRLGKYAYNLIRKNYSIHKQKSVSFEGSHVNESDEESAITVDNTAPNHNVEDKK